jgi:hypothetical protein
VSENNYRPLQTHKCDRTRTEHLLDWCSSARLRGQLIDEIHSLDEQLARLQAAEKEIDFSLQQTCREMIQSRQRLFEKIRR